MIKATKVDGVYNKDPIKFSDAEFIADASYDEVITKNLRVMDHTAIALAKENNMKLKVVSLYNDGAIMRAILGKKE
jgi:uridylate kinase